MTRERMITALMALALGDALGAPHEGGPLERTLWSVMGRRRGKRRWTDDTQMTVNVIQSLLACGEINQDDLARRFSSSYRWSRGYGPGAAKILKRIAGGQPWQVASRSVYRQGSYGNGGAMRAPAIGLFFAGHSENEIIHAARACAEITHAHSLGLEGAAMIALATALAFQGHDSAQIMAKLAQYASTPEFLNRLQIAETWLREKNQVSPQMLKDRLGNGIAAAESCVTAIYLALLFREKAFDSLLDYIISLRGDVDTIASMACAIWGAMHTPDALPQAWLNQLEQQDFLRSLAEAFADAVGKAV